MEKQNRQTFIQICKKKERAQIIKIRNERGEVTSNITEIQRIRKGNYKQLYANKLEKLVKMSKFLELYNFPRLIMKEQIPEQTNN